MNTLRSRIAISSIFFLHGLCFGSWGSRIPAIQDMHHLSESELGTLLLSIPVGQILSMPLAASLVARFGSRQILSLAIVLYAFVLTTLGFAPTATILILCLMTFGLASNMVNVSLNTQAVELEAIYKKPIMASFHGLWSSAGFVAAAIGAVMIGQNITPFIHFVFISIAVLIAMYFCSQSLLPGKPQTVAKSSFSLPDRSILGLGLIAFLSMMCEGAMFDWSGIYFKKVIHAEGAWIGAGYVAFMTTMAGTRFIADKFKEKFGLITVMRISGLLIFSGLMLSVLFPYLVSSILGFFMVGAGVSALVPMVFSEAGRSKIITPSAAIAAVSTIGFLGFLIGPPVIGWIAGLSSLRTSFTLIAFIGLSIAVLAKKATPA
jgi:MFS family permease